MEETENELNYVTPAQAKVLKQLGFDWLCQWSYTGINFDRTVRFSTNNQYESFNARPTVALAIKWLREAKNIHLFISFFDSDDRKSVDKYYYKFVPQITNGHYLTQDTYEEAEYVGLAIALDYLLKQKSQTP